VRSAAAAPVVRRPSLVDAAIAVERGVLDLACRDAARERRTAPTARWS